MTVNRLKATICSILAITILAVSLLSGCNKSKTSDSPSKANSSREEVLGYPIVKEGQSITLKYWMPMQAAAAPYIRNAIEIDTYAQMEKVTGIKVEYIHPAIGQEGEQFNLVLASGDYPDIIQTAARYKGGVQAGVDDGIYLDLTTYAEKYAPDYYKLLKSNQDVWRQNTYDGGKIFSFNRVKPKADAPFQRISTRQDWLEQANMKDPRTLSDWEAYLKWVKDNKPGVAPYLLAQNGVEQIILGAYNILDDFYLKDGKKVDYGKIQPEFKEYLTLMNKWYANGYISKDFTTFNAQKALNEFGAGKTAAMVSSAGNAFTQGINNKFVSAPAPYPRLKPDDKLHWFNVEWTSTGQETIVTTQSKYKNEAIRWLNYAYSEDGALLFNYGIKDQTWKMVNGKPQYTDYPTTDPKFKGNTSAAGTVIRIHQAPKLTYPDLECNFGLLVGGQDQINARLKWADDPGIDNTYVLPPVRLNSEETAKRAPIMTEVNTYANEMILKFILGVEPLSRYDEYVAQIKKLGIDEAIKITQQAYERYMKN